MSEKSSGDGLDDFLEIKTVPSDSIFQKAQLPSFSNPFTQPSG